MKLPAYICFVAGHELIRGCSDRERVFEADMPPLFRINSGFTKFTVGDHTYNLSTTMAYHRSAYFRERINKTGYVCFASCLFVYVL